MQELTFSLKDLEKTLGLSKGKVFSYLLCCLKIPYGDSYEKEVLHALMKESEEEPTFRFSLSTFQHLSSSARLGCFKKDKALLPPYYGLDYIDESVDQIESLTELVALYPSDDDLTLILGKAKTDEALKNKVLEAIKESGIFLKSSQIEIHEASWGFVNYLK